jgi:hypothetical protein
MIFSLSEYGRRPFVPDILLLGNIQIQALLLINNIEIGL